jgi:hypothetical protein
MIQNKNIQATAYDLLISSFREMESSGYWKDSVLIYVEKTEKLLEELLSHCIEINEEEVLPSDKIKQFIRGFDSAFYSISKDL